MIDLTTEFGQRADQRLREEKVIWLTTITPNCVAQPNPVWFYWDGEVIVLYSQPGSYRIRNIQNNNKVTINLQGADVLGKNVLVIQGEAYIKNCYPRPHPGYEKKYEKYLPDLGMTFNQLVDEYSVEIIVRPNKLRGTL